MPHDDTRIVSFRKSVCKADFTLPEVPIVRPLNSFLFPEPFRDSVRAVILVPFPMVSLQVSDTFHYVRSVLRTGVCQDSGSSAPGRSGISRSVFGCPSCSIWPLLLLWVFPVLSCCRMSVLLSHSAAPHLQLNPGALGVHSTHLLSVLGYFSSRVGCSRIIGIKMFS